MKLITPITVAVFSFSALGITPEVSALAQSVGDKPGEMVGAWEIETLTEGFSDVTRGIAHTRLGAGASVVIKCDEPGDGKLYVSFLTTKYLGSDNVRRELRRAKYRLDDGAAAELPKPYYVGYGAALLEPEGRQFLGTLVNMNPKRFRAQFLTYDSEFSEIDVDVTGIAEVIRKTAAICKDSTLL